MRHAGEIPSFPPFASFLAACQQWGYLYRPSYHSIPKQTHFCKGEGIWLICPSLILPPTHSPPLKLCMPAHWSSSAHTLPTSTVLFPAILWGVVKALFFCHCLQWLFLFLCFPQVDAANLVEAHQHSPVLFSPVWMEFIFHIFNKSRDFPRFVENYVHCAWLQSTDLSVCKGALLENQLYGLVDFHGPTF